MKRLFSLKLKIASLILGSIFFFGALATFSIFYLTQRILIEKEKDFMSYLVQAAGSELDLLISDRLSMSHTVANCGEVIAYLSQEDPTPQDPDVIKPLNHFSSEEYLAVYLMDTEGLTLASTDPAFTGNNYSFRTYFKEAIKGNPTMAVAQGVTSNEMGFYFSYPVRGDGEEIIGVLVTKLDPEHVHKRISNSPMVKRLVSDTHVYLTDEDGVIISSSNSERLMNPIFPIDAQKKEEILRQRRYGDIGTSTNFNYDLKKLSSLEFPTVLILHDNVYKDDEIVSVTKISSNPSHYLFLSVDIAGVSRSAYTLSAVLALFVFLAALTCALFIYVYISKFLRPLKELQDVSEQVEAGNLKARVKNITSDELGDFSNAFNRMIDEVEKTRSTLKEEVEKKTENLQDSLAKYKRLNKLMVKRELKMREIKEKLKKDEQR